MTPLRIHDRALRGSLALLLMAMGVSTAMAGEGRSKREERRSAIPVDQLVKRLEDPARVGRMQPERVLDVLGVKEGETVADLGAGTGFFTFRLASRVGASGRVYAVEIEDRLLEFIGQKMKQNGVTNIVPVKSSDVSANLPPASCDRILVVNSYAYFDDPVAFMRDVRSALKPGGVVAVIDLDEDKVREKRKAIRKKLPETGKLRFARDVIAEMQRAGYTLKSAHDFLESRHYLLFTATPHPAGQ